MKLYETGEVVEEFGNVSKSKEIVGSVQLKNQALLVDFVGNQVYSDPHGSIIRELTSNCYDAHVKLEMVTGIPVEDAVIVKYEEVEGQGFLSFRDFGIGMTPELVSDIYVNLLDSSKRDNNNEHGGFGMGSKSFLSYTDSIDLITICDGIKYHYIVGKNQDGLISATLLFEQPTEEKRGTEVRLIVKDISYGNSRYDSKDYRLFQKAVLEQLYYFDNVYTEGFDQDNNYSIYETETFKYRSSYDVNPFEELHIILGKVVYPIDWKIIGREAIKLPVGIKFNIGDLQVTLSRENIRYADSVIVDKIRKAIDKCIDEVRELYNKNSATLPTLERYLQAKEYNSKKLVIQGLSITLPTTYDYNRPEKYRYVDVINGLNPLKLEALKHVPLLSIPNNPYFILQLKDKVEKVDGHGKTKLLEFTNDELENIFLTVKINYSKVFRLKSERNKASDKFITHSKGSGWITISKKKIHPLTYWENLELGEKVKRDVPYKKKRYVRDSEDNRICDNEGNFLEELVNSTRRVTIRTPLILKGLDENSQPYIWNKTRIIKAYKKAIIKDVIARTQSYEEQVPTAAYLSQLSLEKVSKRKIKKEGHVTVYDLVIGNGTTSSEFDLSILNWYKGFIIYAEKDRMKELKMVRDMLSNQKLIFSIKDQIKLVQIGRCYQRSEHSDMSIIRNEAGRIIITAKANHQHFKENPYFMHLDDFLSNNNRMFRNSVTAWYIKKELKIIEKKHSKLYENITLFSENQYRLINELEKWTSRLWNSYYSIDDFMTSCYEVAKEKNMLVIDKIEELEKIKEWFTDDLSIIELLDEKAFTKEEYIKDIVLLLKIKKKRLSAEHYFIPTVEEVKVLEEAKEQFKYKLSLEPMIQKALVYNSKLLRQTA